MSAAAREHEFEAAHGLPEPLPADERVLWQGGPDWRALAVRAFHLRKIAVYFTAILALRGASVLSSGGSAHEAVAAALWLLPLALLAIGLLALMAWLSSRAAVYTITSKRIVMRIGIVLTVTFNLPFRSIENADLRLDADGTGDIPLTLKAPSRIAYLHLWPHARPWRVARPQPMLRAIPDASRVAQILAGAWSQATGFTVQPTTAAVPPRRAAEPRPVLVTRGGVEA